MPWLGEEDPWALDEQQAHQTDHVYQDKEHTSASASAAACMGHVDASLIRQHVSLPHYASLRGCHVASFAYAMGACSPYTYSERISTGRDLFIQRCDDLFPCSCTPYLSEGMQFQPVRHRINLQDSP